MDYSKKLLKSACERCENYAENMVCEDMNTCAVYNLYLIAKSKTKVVYKRDYWQTPPTPRPEMI